MIKKLEQLMNDDGLRRACVKTAISTRGGAFDLSQRESCLPGWSDPPCKSVSSEPGNGA